MLLYTGPGYYVDGDCLLTGKPSRYRYVTNRLGQLSLPSFRDKLIEYKERCSKKCGTGTANSRLV